MSAPPGRVLIIGEFGAGALAVAYARAFEALGWQTTRYDMQAGYTRGAVLARARGLRRLLRPLLWSIMARETAALAARAELDLVLAIKAPYLGAGGLALLRGATSAPLAMLYPDSPYGAYVQRRGLPAVLARFDRVYIWSRQLLARLHADGVAAATYLPFGYDPVDYGAVGPVARPECGRRHAIAFIGQRYDKRARWLAALRGLDVGVWGLGWEGDSTLRESGACVHRAAAHGPAAAAIYRGATVAVNILHADNVPAHNMRTFEIPPCRTVMLTEATVEIDAFFEPGRACLTAATPGALRAQAERALGDATQARAVAAEGARLVGVRHHHARARAIVADAGVGRRLLAMGRDR